MPEPLSERPPPGEAIPELRFLKLLVTGLAVVMGVGIIAIVALLWLRLTPAAPALPEGLRLPEGAVPAAVTLARDWTVVLTDAGEVLVYDRAGALKQRVPLPAE